MRVHVSPFSGSAFYLREPIIFFFFFFFFLTVVIPTGESQPSLGQLMRFITGVSSVPPLGLHPLIRVKLDSASAQLPTTESCFNTIHLPMGIHQKQQFFEAMNRGILYSGSYYGLW